MVTECDVVALRSMVLESPSAADVPQNTWLVAAVSVFQVIVAPFVVGATMTFEITGADLSEMNVRVFDP